MNSERKDPRCCNGDCAQGRWCPERSAAWTPGDVIFTVVMMVVTGTTIVSIVWWAVSAALMIAEVLK